MKKKQSKTIKSILIKVAILSIILYAAGVYTGVKFSKEIEQSTITKIIDLEEQLQALESKTKSAQLYEQYMYSLNENEICEFSEEYKNYLTSELEVYWSTLPARLEEYESNNVLTDEYIQIKKKYTQSLINSWINIKTLSEKCDNNLVPILYFYTSNCEECIKQGENLDEAKISIRTKGLDPIIFTIDLNSDEPVIRAIANKYEIQDAPAIIIKENALKGRLITPGEITRAAQ